MAPPAAGAVSFGAMDVFRKIVATVTAIAMAVTFVGLGFLACTLPPVTQGLSSAFALDDLSPFDRNQLVKVADATRDFSFGNHDALALYKTIYEVDSEYAATLEKAGGTVPVGFPALGMVGEGATLSQYEAAFANASEMYCYSPATISHLDDCHAIAQGAYPALVAVAIIAVFGLVFTAVTGGARRLGSVLLGSGVGTLVAFVVLGIWALVDFTGMFTVFHQVFFAQQGNWTFPYDSLLICSLPEAFWAGMGAVWLATAIVLSAVSIVVGLRLRRR